MVNKKTRVILQRINLTQTSKFHFGDVLFGRLGFIKKFSSVPGTEGNSCVCQNGSALLSLQGEEGGAF